MSPAKAGTAPFLASEGSPPVELWLIDLHAAAATLDEIERAVPRLSDIDREKIEAITDAGLRRERRATYIALRILLERTWGDGTRTLAYSYSDAGKPHVPGVSGDFSLSHAPGFALVGLSPSAPLGVDLETPRDVKIAEERRERIERTAAALVADVPLPRADPARLLQAWVRLEALAKAEGCGLAHVLTRYGILGRGPAPDHAMRAGTQGASFRIVDLKFEQPLLGAVALAGAACGEISPRMFPADADAIAALLADRRMFGR